MNIMQETMYSLDQLYGIVKTKSLKKTACKFTRTQTDCSRKENGKKFRLTKDFFQYKIIFLIRKRATPYVISTS